MMKGRCYCGALQYEALGEPQIKAQCHCRECQYISGGGPNYFLLMPVEGYSYTAGNPASFTRGDLENPVTREFCAICGTHMITRLPNRPVVVLKAGTLDDPTVYDAPQMAIHTLDKQPFHIVPDGVAAFDRLPQA